ncbi:Acyl-CoA dehydrogenase family member 10 [Lachnellula arida]|uniref:Acyl-CoA dehydrogenase family member 10 n=1 Tax=Lachnellula arida TaxID=1316785 RepID=A0A8T9B4M8_9HELO|nr:Acyl-CoA dehydrogenase family member 10 [Lachnellula arida]
MHFNSSHSIPAPTNHHIQVVSPFQAILDYELSLSIPPGWVNHSISSTAPTGTWQALERGEILLDSHFFRAFHTDLHNPDLWRAFYEKKHPNTPIPPLPQMDVEHLYWSMMHASRHPDPWMYPALLALKASSRYTIAALSNTVIFPPSHPFSNPPSSAPPLSTLFDVFISSAHVGLRKPDPAIYDLALAEVDSFSRSAGRGAVQAHEVLFLDDIGENLKAGRRRGFRTLKVKLGRAFEAVEELEGITGLELAGTHPRVAVEAKSPGVLPGSKL